MSRTHIALLPLSLAFLMQACGSKTAAKPEMPPPVVLVADVKQEDVPLTNEFVGSLEGLVNAAIQARVSGYLIEQHYKEGRLVKKGDLLFTIDSRPFEAALAQAKAALAQAEAAEKQAELLADRNVDLFKRNAVSAQERDNSVQSYLAAQAQVRAQRAAVEQAVLDVEFARITAPVDGIAGIARAQVGNLVGPSTGPLTTVSTVDPIKAYFNVSEQAYVEYRMRFPDPQAREEHENNLKFTLILADGSRYPEIGRIFAMDREVDARTGALRIAATFPNPYGILRPGQFARVQVQDEIKHDALLVPQRAVTELQGSYQLAVVDSKNVVSIRPVTVGERIGSDWIIEKGIKPGERVVVEGIQKVRDGAAVAPEPWAPPASAEKATAANTR